MPPANADPRRLLELMKVISAEPELAPLIERLQVLMAETVGADRCLVAYDQRGSLVLSSPEGGVPIDESPSAPARLMRWVVANGELELDDAFLDARFEADPHLRRERPHSVLAAPLAARGNVNGVIYAESKRPSAFGPQCVAVMGALAAQASIAIANAQALEQNALLIDRLGTLLDTIGDGVVVIGADGIIELVNQETEKIFGYARDELVGTTVHTIMPERYRERHDEAFQRRVDSDEPMPERYVEVEGRRKDGSTFPLELRFSQATIEGRSVFTGALRDITERVRARDEIRRLSAELAAERDYLREEVRNAGRFGHIIGQSGALKLVLAQIEAVAKTNATVLVTGESGVGKELVARAIHEASPRSDAALVRVNCATVPRDLFESEFFGHRKGAFTGAVRDRDGRFQLANGGTIFLDEVGEIPLELQSKLLRVLQEHEFERVGDDETRHVDVRVVAATNKDLPTEVSEGRFREDLYYRLGVFPLVVPPLRERPEDVIPLALHFLDLAAVELNIARPQLSKAVADHLERYTWPGNIRELQNVMERAAILAAGAPIRLEMLGLSDLSRSGATRRRPARSKADTVDDAATLRAALEEHGGNIQQTARALGVSRQALYRRLEKYGIPRPSRS